MLPAGGEAGTCPRLGARLGLLAELCKANSFIVSVEDGYAEED